MTDQQVAEKVQAVRKAVLGVSAADRRAWELVTNVPMLTNVWAYVCLIINCILPGWGTILSSWLGDVNINKT